MTWSKEPQRPPRPPHRIESDKNEIFRNWKKLLEAKGISKQTLFLLSGRKLINEFLSSNSAHRTQHDISHATSPMTSPLLRYSIQAEILREELTPLTPASVRKFVLPSALFNELDVLGTHFNILVVELPTIPVWQARPLNFQRTLKKNHLEVVIPLGDPGNLGALIRSAVGFGADQIILTAESCHPFLPKALKAAAGTTLFAPLARGPRLEELIQESTHVDTVILDVHGISIRHFQWPQQTRLILGEEGPGVPQLEKHSRLHKVTIPTDGIESLNATVAGSIALHEWKQNLQSFISLL